MSILQKSNSRVSSRRQINIKGVKDNVLILPGNQYRVILSVSSVNFELKSEAEQNALIDVFQSFLNSLACPLQIIVRVRELDMDKYVDDFKAGLATEREKIYKSQIRNYTEFVESLITNNKILSRHFYVVVPFVGYETDFEIISEQLNLNMDIVAKGLARLGMQSHQLTSLELLDLFYSFYNPGQAKRQPITKYTLDLLNKSHI